MAKFKLKKVLALALATATAFTFTAPTGLFQTSIVAYASAADHFNATGAITLDASSATIASVFNTNLTIGGTTYNQGADLAPGYLWVNPGSTATIEVNNTDTWSATSIEPTVLAAPDGWTVTAAKVVAGDNKALISVKAPSTAATTDINAGPNLIVKIKNGYVRLIATNSNYIRRISGKDSIDISSTETNLTMGTIVGATKANLSGFTAGKVKADSALAAGIVVKNGTTVLTMTDENTYTAGDTVSVKESAAGTSGNLTFSVEKGKIAFPGTANHGKQQDVDVLAASKTVKVNLLTTVAAKNGALKVGTGAAQTIPFKVLTSVSTDVTASEVDTQGNALSSATAGVTIDNTNKVIKLAANFNTTTNIKFVPKDATKQGTGDTVTITGVPGQNSSNDVMIAGGAVAVPSNGSYAVTFTKPLSVDGATTYNSQRWDKVAFAFKDDAVDKLIGVSYGTNATMATAAKNGDGTNDNDVGGIKFTVGNGVPAGTYTGYVFFVDTMIADADKAVTPDNLLDFQEVNIVVTGAAKDLPRAIGINKVNDTEYWTYGEFNSDTLAAQHCDAAVGNGYVATAFTATSAAAIKHYDGTEGTATLANGNAYSVAGGDATSNKKFDGVEYTLAQASAAAAKVAKLEYQSATLLSGVDTTVTLTSPIKEAGVVKDIAIGSLQVENAGTGARVNEGFTADGMNIKIAGSALTAGTRFNVYVTTKGTGINESDTMTKTGTHLTLTVQQGYTFNYNYNGAKVKDGKEVKTVSISSDDTTSVKLENGSNLEYTGATFLGWAYTADAKTADITAADAKNGLSKAQIKTSIDKQVNAVIELYGVWDFTTYTMSFDANGGTGSENGKNFTVAATDITLPTAFTNGNKPLVGWCTTSTGKTAAGGVLPVYSGTLNGAQLQAIVAEVDPTAKTTAIKMYAQYGAALKSVSIAPATVSLTAKGATAQLTTEVLDENNAKMTTATVTFKSDNEGVATVDANGVVTAVANGTANVTATAKLGTVEVTSTACVVTVNIAKKAVTFKNVKKTFKVATLKKAKKSYSVIKASDGGKVTYKVTKGTKKYITVSKAGKVTVKKGATKGTYKVKITVAAKGNYKKTVKTITIVVK